MDHIWIILDHLRQHGLTRQQEGNKGHDPFEKIQRQHGTKGIIDPHLFILGNIFISLQSSQVPN